MKRQLKIEQQNGILTFKLNDEIVMTLNFNNPNSTETLANICGELIHDAIYCNSIKNCYLHDNDDRKEYNGTFLEYL